MEKNIIQRLIDAGIITKNDIDEYNKQSATGLIRKQTEQNKDDEIEAIAQKSFREIYEKNLREEHAFIENGVLVNFKEGEFTEKYVVPSYVTEIKEKAFSDCKKLKQVIIPKGIKEIKYATFAHCENLESVILPNSVEEIHNDAFVGCGFKYIDLPKNLKIIGRGAFYGTKLESVEIPDSVEEIYNHAFQDNKKLVKVNLPSGLKIVRRHIFDGCENLEEISIPEGVEEIRESAFNGCKSLSRVYLPQSLQSIDRGTFYKCESLMNINATSILMKVNLPSNIRYLCYSAFDRTPVQDFVREWADKNKITQWPGQTFEETKTK
ncbi:MAG: leucine-rich repeat domain-containing protein [Clostridia bacterium]|nr:leucine-rich repeat domain-containing protein [Clostridia bacterium]